MAKQILENAGFDHRPDLLGLSEIHPEHISFERKPDEEIHMHQHMKFIAVSSQTDPGIELLKMPSFAEQLKTLGYEIKEEGDRISFPFKIEIGKASR